MANPVRSHVERTFVMIKPEGVRRNLIGALNGPIHVSDSPETAAEEIALWFPEGVEL
jgi:nucleoside diphosphate kinase